MPGLDPRLRAMMLEDIAKRLTPTAIRMRADIEVAPAAGTTASCTD